MYRMCDKGRLRNDGSVISIKGVAMCMECVMRED